MASRVSDSYHQSRNRQVGQRQEITRTLRNHHRRHYSKQTAHLGRGLRLKTIKAFERQTGEPFAKQ